jgi:hypothetical protein
MSVTAACRTSRPCRALLGLRPNAPRSTTPAAIAIARSVRSGGAAVGCWPAEEADRIDHVVFTLPAAIGTIVAFQNNAIAYNLLFATDPARSVRRQAATATDNVDMRVMVSVEPQVWKTAVRPMQQVISSSRRERRARPT